MIDVLRYSGTVKCIDVSWLDHSPKDFILVMLVSCRRMSGGMMSRKGINISEKNGQWVGDEASLSALHAWVRRRLPKPERCQKCRKKGFIELSCIGHDYKRNLRCWRYLCRSCHSSIDKKIFNILRGVRKFFPCPRCGIIIKNPKRYCKPCARIVRLDWWKKYNYKRRHPNG
jgi:uncharacterized C2H2 Zn-finger protein